uniref:Uncharacterized protein n=1 Tax=Sander lucioperca TaxID=283035 RepID=A0A8C9ZX13_SANLU
PYKASFFLLWLILKREAIGEMNVCFILDGILILYGVILTVLYCRLRVRYTGTTYQTLHIVLNISALLSDPFHTLKSNLHLLINMT